MLQAFVSVFLSMEVAKGLLSPFRVSLVLLDPLVPPDTRDLLACPVSAALVELLAPRVRR